MFTEVIDALTIGDRIKEFRKSENLTQEDFGRRISMTKSFVSLLESGRNHPTDQTIKLMCHEFNVSPQWLRTGEGPMVMPEDEDDEIIDRVLAGVDPVPKAILRGLSKMPGGWDAIAQAVRLCYAELEKIENDGGRKAD